MRLSRLRIGIPLEIRIGRRGESPDRFIPDGEEEEEEIHKLQVKYIFTPGSDKDLKSAMTVDEELFDDPETPIERPQDRYACSDKRLFHYLDGELDIVATLLEGEIIQGNVSWFSRYEFGMQREGKDIGVIFRHALFHLRKI